MTDLDATAEARSQIEHYCDNMITKTSLLGESFALIWSAYDRLAADLAEANHRARNAEAKVAAVLKRLDSVARDTTLCRDLRAALGVDHE